MDYEAKFISLINDESLPIEQRKKLEEIFNACKEDEDERIRKWLIRYFEVKSDNNVIFADVSLTDVLAWLEKQSEQKPKWGEEDSLMIDSIIDTIKWLEGKGATNMKIDWLKSIKKRMEE